jgi:hypothetical protein
MLTVNGLPPIPRHDNDEISFADNCYYSSILK